MLARLRSRKPQRRHRGQVAHLEVTTKVEVLKPWAHPVDPDASRRTTVPKDLATNKARVNLGIVWRPSTRRASCGRVDDG